MKNIKFDDGCLTCKFFSADVVNIAGGFQYVEYHCAKENLFELGVGPCEFYKRVEREEELSHELY